MLAKDLLNEQIPPLKTSDSVEKALSWMAEFKVSHLPIVNDVQFLGLISEEDLLECNTPTEAIGSLRLTLMNAFIYEWQHFYEIIRLIALQKLSVVPVIDQKNNYKGLVSMADLMTKMASLGAMDNPGGIIILEIGIRDYSLSEISRIIESNDASILSSYITSHVDSTKLELTLKINKTDLSAIIAAFERYNYTIKASYHESEFAQDTMDRYDQLMKYLNI